MPRASIAPLAAALIMSACAADGSSRPRPDGPPPAADSQGVTATGVLRSGVAAIGGETTGWALEGSSLGRWVEIDISAVRPEAQRLAGSRVRVTGDLTSRRFVERGEVRVLRARTLAPAD